MWATIAGVAVILAQAAQPGGGAKDYEWCFDRDQGAFRQRDRCQDYRRVGHRAISIPFARCRAEPIRRRANRIQEARRGSRRESARYCLGCGQISRSHLRDASRRARAGLSGNHRCRLCEKVRLIVMASHGRRGVSAVVLGSETVKVLTHSKIPVLVYR